MLTKEQISEGNELIARFRGGKKKLIFSHTPVWEFPDGTTYRHAFLKYHNSWSKLMPVVEQIEKYRYGHFPINFTIFGSGAIISVNESNASGENRPSLQISNTLNINYFIEDHNQPYSKIEGVYLAIVEFIKHINNL